MNDDIVLEPGEKTSDDVGTPQEQDTEARAAVTPNESERVFDVTADLNISPSEEDQIDPIQSTKIVDSALKQSIPKKPEPGVAKATTAPVPTQVPTAPIAPTPKITIPQQVETPIILKPQESINIPHVQSAYSSMPEAEKTVPGISAIRTYESDIAELITKKGTSTAGMMMAENKKETGQKDQIINKEQSRAGRKSFMAVLSLLLILVGVAGAYYLYSVSPLAPSALIAPQPAPVVSLIPADSQKTFAVDGLNANSVLSKIQAEVSSSKAAGSIEEVILYTTINGIKTRLTINDAIKLMDIPVPDTLARSLTASWMLGIYTDNQNKNSAFIIVTNNFFQNAFAGMLSWESVMPDDLKRYIYPAATMGIANVPTQTNSPATMYVDPLSNLNSILPMSGSSTNVTPTSASSSAKSSVATQSKLASSTNSSKKESKLAISTTTANTTGQASTTEVDASVTPYLTLKGQFVDKIVKNKDVREFVTINGDTLFLYSFIDNSKLVIAGNEAALAEIITRLEKQAFVR